MEFINTKLDQKDVAAAFSNATNVKGLTRVALLKQLEIVGANLFRVTTLANEKSEALKTKMVRVIFESNMAGIEEFSAEWFYVIKAKMACMQAIRDVCEHAFLTLQGDTGFDEFERALILGSIRISTLYDPYYLAYLATVQEENVLTKIATNPPPADDAACHNSYTVVLPSTITTSGFTTQPFARYFSATLTPIIAAMNDMIAAMKAVEGLNADQRAYIDFFEHYRDCHQADTDPATLEAMWTGLDRKWMDTKLSIQIVHDIETGYGDPLRVKATPDFSLRFLDETYGEQNKLIADIQGHMVEYFKGRNTKIANAGLTALQNTMAGIYYIPFKTGISLQFSFSGQSIPNRQDVAVEKGIKIYFDAVETAARVQLNMALIEKVFKDPAGVIAKYKPEAVEQLVWHVAAHEVGHAIYNLATVEEALGSKSVVALLEEPRAELTAMWTLRLLHSKGVLTLPHLKETLAHFVLDGLRYFNKFKSEPLRPYIIFQIYAYKTYFETGYLSLVDGEVVIDDSKTLEVLEVMATQYLEILDCEDAANGPALQKIMDMMAEETDFIRHVVSKVLVN